MKLVCDKCGFSELSENFHVILTNVQGKQNIYIGCPSCGFVEFFNHGSLDKGLCMATSHLFSPTVEQCPTREEAVEYVKKQIADKKLRDPNEILADFYNSFKKD